MDKWLATANVPIKMDARDLSPIRTKMAGAAKSSYIVLGILGVRNKVTYEEFVEQILDPVLEIWGAPSEILAAEESLTSFFIEQWARGRDPAIPITLMKAEWFRNGRKAGMLRDNRIQREATHLVLLQGPRSNAMTGLAGKLRAKGRPVALSERPGEALRLDEKLAV